MGDMLESESSDRILIWQTKDPSLTGSANSLEQLPLEMLRRFDSAWLHQSMDLRHQDGAKTIDRCKISQQNDQILPQYSDRFLEAAPSLQ